MQVAEIYKSAQGEGRLTGVESVFVRASGCNLRCWFCDTPFASWRPEGDDLSVDEIVSRIFEWDCEHIVLTGGEPMLFSELTPLCQRLRTAGRHITIETAGTLHLPVQCDLMSISPKTANSAPDRAEQPRWRARHEQTRWAPLVLQRLMSEHDHQLKFVVDTPDDCDEIEQLVEQLNAARQRVYLMPQGVTPEQLADRGDWLEAECRRRGLRFCPRRQIEWFGLTRGT